MCKVLYEVENRFEEIRHHVQVGNTITWYSLPLTEATLLDDERLISF